MSRAPDWEIQGRTWPNHAASRFETYGGTRWHLQREGRGPGVLLIHGTGAASHSWADLFPLLSATYDVLAIDLPGHGFTQAATRFRPSLGGMSNAIATLLEGEAFEPSLIVGHSAGAAIALHGQIEGVFSADRIVSINGALFPFEGPAGFLFPGLAKAFSLNPLTARAAAWAARDRRRVERLISQTGSRVASSYVDKYAMLLGHASQISGALAMMANWDLASLSERLHACDVPTLFLAGKLDRAIPPADAFRAAARVQLGTAEQLASLGHLAHEEDAGRVLSSIEEWMA